MALERVNPPSLARPSGFSHAVVATGRLVFLAGQVALGADGAIVGDSIAEQFDRALANLLEALRAAGGAPADLASLTLTAGRAVRSERRGGGSSAGSTRRWQRSAYPGSGTPLRWSRSRAARSSLDHREGVGAGRCAQALA
jgi:hypothetical protein